MSDVQLYLISVNGDKEEASRIARSTAQKLQNKEVKLLDIVGSLGEFLNNDDGSIRAKTLSYLAEVLQAIPPKVLSGQQRNLLCDFVLSRISDDTEGLGSCAKALLALEERGQWDQARVVNVINTLLNQTHPLVQHKQQSERYPVIVLIDLLLSKYRDAIHSIHRDTPGFLLRFISYFDGEKDPRNLMIVFSILRVIGTEWNVSSNTQDVFEASFNYFPITFRPPPDDPYGITAQDLKDRLKACISATPEFSPYAFPALLDKLDSTSTNVKRDVLQAMFSCVHEYGPNTVNMYSVTLWDALKFEVLHVQEEDLAEEALKVLAEIGRQLAGGSSGALTAYIKPVAKECNEHLEDAPTKQSQGATRIIFATASSSALSCNLLLSAILPNLFQLYQGTRDVAKRRSLVETLSQLIRADIVVFGEWRRNLADEEQRNPEKKLNNPLQDFVATALETLVTALSSASISQVSYRLVILDALLQLAKVRALLLDDQISKIIELLDHIVIAEESYGKDELKAAATSGLVEIAHQKPQLVISQSFPEFLGKLPDKDENGPETYVPVLEAFAKLGGEEQVFDIVVRRLKNKLNAAIQQHASATYVQAILSALLYAFTQAVANFPSNSTISNAFSDFIKPLLQMICLKADIEQQEDATFYLVGRLCNIILAGQSTDAQALIAPEVYTLYLGESENEAPPFKHEIPTEQNRRLILSTYIIAALRRDVTLPQPPNKILNSLMSFVSQETLTIGIQLAGLQHISLIINKFLPSAAIQSTLQPLITDLGDFSSPKSPSSTRTIFAVLKALVLRNASSIGIIDSLISALSDPQIGTAIAHGFATLLQPDEILNKENHCMISPLYKQKTFAVLIPKITSAFNRAEPPAKKNRLIALAGITRYLPYTVFEPQLTTLTPLLLQSLDIEGEEEVKNGTIDTLSLIVSENPTIIEEHASSVISRLLNCGSAKQNSANVRAKALRCLTLIVVQLRTELVIPFRKQVIKRLTIPLDDRKRLVRVEAVKCRSKWIELDEAGDDDE